jgi:hypothetical protein
MDAEHEQTGSSPSSVSAQRVDAVDANRVSTTNQLVGQALAGNECAERPNKLRSCNRRKQRPKLEAAQAAAQGKMPGGYVDLMMHQST